MIRSIGVRKEEIISTFSLALVFPQSRDACDPTPKCHAAAQAYMIVAEFWSFVSKEVLDGSLELLTIWLNSRCVSGSRGILCIKVSALFNQAYTV